MTELAGRRQRWRHPAARRGAGQRRPALVLGRSRRGRGRLRQGGSRHQAPAHQQPGLRRADGAARRHRQLRGRPLDGRDRLPGRLRPARPAGRPARRRDRADAGALERYRRLVRDEGLRLPRASAAHACRKAAGQPGQVDQRPVRELHHRLSRPRFGVRRGTRPRRRRQFPCRKARWAGQSRRLCRGLRRRRADHGAAEEPGQRLPHAAHGESTSSWSSPPPHRPPPIAVPAGPRPSTSWSG